MGIATSKAAQVTLTIAPSVAAILSIAGSSYIVHHILRENKHKQDVRFRLLLLLSIADLLNSISVCLFWSLPLPSDTPNVWGALGNKQTCDLQGFLAQWTGITNAFYNGALCHFYYFMLVGHNNSNSLRASTGKGGAQLFAQRYEKWWHAVAWGFPITTAILALWPLDVYAYVHIGCWIGPYPLGCTTNSDVECTRGRHAYVWGWLFGGIPLLAMLAVVGYFIFQIYQHIRQVTQQSEQYAFPSNVNGLDRSGENDISGVRSSGISSTRFSSGRASSNNMVGDNDHHNESNVDQLQDRGVLAEDADQLHGRDVSAENLDQMQELSAPIEVMEYGLNEGANERDNAPSTPQFESKIRQFSSTSSSSSHRNSTNAQPQNITRLQAQRKESATQAFLYIGAYCSSSSNSSPILLLQKGLCLDSALQLANKLIYQSELVAGQQNEVNSF